MSGNRAVVGRGPSFADQVALVSHEKYSSLPKTGKPKPESEWTLLSSVVQVCGSYDDPSESTVEGLSFEVVALGTGSKCIGKSDMSPAGDVLNDSHAEVVARRGFLRYLYHEVSTFYKTGLSNIFKGVVNGKCVLKDDVSFHFYTSQVPCGDGSIFRKDDLVEEDYGDILQQVGKGASESGVCKQDSKEPYLLGSKSSGKMHVTCTSIKNTSCDGESESPQDCSHVTDEVSSCKRKLETESNLDPSRNAKRRTSQTEASSSPSKRRKMPALKRAVATRLEFGAAKPSVAFENSSKTPEERFNTTAELADHENGYVRPAEDIHRTGAKCLSSEPRDPYGAGVDYHVVGVLRTKPGRGDPTISLSCSDKLARWNAVGCQGALLSLLAEPIRFRSLIVGGLTPFLHDALNRAIVQRTHAHQCDNATPMIRQSSVGFSDRKPSCGSKQPCPTSIVWCKVENRPLEVAVKGRKQGVTKKVARTPAGRLQICKRELAQQFVTAVASIPGSRSLAIGELAGMDPGERTEFLGGKSYGRLKAMATDHQQKWGAVKEKCFPSWPVKPPALSEFTLNS